MLRRSHPRTPPGRERYPGLSYRGEAVNRVPLSDQLRTAATCFDAACALANTWVQRLPGHPSPAEGLGDDYLEWGERVEQIRSSFAERTEGAITATDRAALIEASQGGLMSIHATCWGLDLATWPSYTSAWVAGHDGPWEPDDGEWFPVVDWPANHGWSLSTRPAAVMADADHFPHLRRYRPPTRPDEVALRFDPSAGAALEGALARLGAVATVHPNLALEEFHVPDGSLVFPIAPAHPDQQQIITALVQSALNAGAALIVVPELAVTPAILDALCDLVDGQWEPVIVTAGSLHTSGDDGEPANVSTTLLPDVELTVRKMVPFTQHVGRARPSKEAIKPGPRTVTVHVAGRWRFATVICKDVLDPHVSRALAFAGVNALTVPAFSDRTDDYIAVAGEFVRRTQGVIVVANNPARFEAAPVIPAAVLGQPRSGAYTVTWPGTTLRPGQRGVVFFTLGHPVPTWQPLT